LSGLLQLVVDQGSSSPFRGLVFSGGAEVYNPCPFPVGLPFFWFAVAGANMYKEKLKDTPKEALNWRLWFTVFGTPALLSQWPFN